MPSISDRLKALGVRVGAQDLPKPARTDTYAIEHILPGEFIENHYGQVFRVQEPISVDEKYGSVSLHPVQLPEIYAHWADAPGLENYAPEDFVFLDVETTGLGLGAGILPFLVGVGRFVSGNFLVDQYFMRHPGDEAPLLAAISSFAHEHRVLVSFNGKAFDEPVLNNRYIINGISSPFTESIHLDLLQLARKLWRMRLPSRSLLNLEGQILEVQRSQEDIPGWVIPQLYQDYLQTGDARLIKNVFYHNAKDILAMAALLNHTGQLLDHPLEKPETHILDLVGIGVLHETLGRTQDAIQIYRQTLQAGLPDQTYWYTHRHLCMLLKRQGEWPELIGLWEEAAASGDISAHIELAKYYEHRVRDIGSALYWTNQVLSILENHPDQPIYQAELAYRQVRLLRKSDRLNQSDQP
jgi:uncharacterized protein